MLFLLPVVSFASITINEVMYDLEGTDSGREWIELKNEGAESVNLLSWKFYENNSNHGLSLYSGEESILPGGFAVVVDSPETFLNDWPSFTGNLFDSSWSSFSNTGESFSIKNEDGDIIDEVTYVPEDGANGDGNSLQLISGEFIPASPTPGLENQSTEQETIASSSNTEQEEETTSVEYISTFGIPERVVSGERIGFEPKLYDNDGKLLFKALFRWSLGDGNSREDEYRKDFYHTYENPGVYVAYLEVFTSSKKDEPNHVYRQTIKVVPASVSLFLVEDGVLIKNKSVYELNIGDWDLVFDQENKFKIPKNTIVLPGKEIIFSFKTLGQSSVANIILQNQSDGAVASVTSLVKESNPVKIKTIYIPVENTPAPVEKIVEDSSGGLEADSYSQLASASSALPEKTGNNSLWFWIYGVLIVSVIGGVSYMYLRNEDEFIEEIKEADKYSIEE